MFTSKKLCKECEPAQVNHFVMRASSYMGLVCKPLLKPLDYFLRVVAAPRTFSWFDVAAPPVLAAAAFFHVGTLQADMRDDDSDRTRALWGEAKRRGITMLMYRCGPIKDLFIARHQGHTRCFDGLPRPVGPEAESLYWMDNKPMMRVRFAEAGIPIARGGAAYTERGGLRIFWSLRKPVITKPYSGSRSRHTTIHIHDKEAFLRGFQSAKVISPKTLIEEELPGFVFRGTLIGGRLVAVIRREPPSVSGDGARTVRELVDEENRRPERHTKTFHPIADGVGADAELARQKLSWESVPERGQFVSLNQKISRGVGASNTDMTDEVHPENRALLEKIGALLGDPLIGVDFILRDVSVSWKKQERCGVIECNSLPFIDLHHYPLNGAPRNVAGALWNIIFPESADARR